MLFSPQLPEPHRAQFGDVMDAVFFISKLKYSEKSRYVCFFPFLFSSDQGLSIERPCSDIVLINLIYEK